MLAVYVRVSTKKQGADGLSLDEQTSEGIEFAKTHGEKYKIYTDIKSGKNIIDRDDFRLLLADIETGLIDAIWCGDISRLTRSMEDGGRLKKLIDGKTLKIYDRGKEISGFEFGLRVVLADEERQKIVANTTRNRRKQIDDGQARYPNLYGFKAKIVGHGKKGMPIREWEIDDGEREIIQLIYDLYEKDFNFDDICAELVQRGYKTKLRGTWDRGTIHLILRRPEYVCMTHDSAGNPIKSEVYKTPIIDRAQWDRVQATIDSKIRNRRGKYFKDKSFDCSGIIKCAKCGAPYFYHRQMSKKNPQEIIHQSYTHKSILYDHRQCKQIPKNVKLESIDILFAALFVLTFGDYKQVAKFVAAEKKKITIDNKELSRTIQRIQQNIGDYEGEKKRLVNAVKRGIMEAEDIADELAKIKDKIAAEKSNLRKFDAEIKMLEESEKAVMQEYASTNVESYLTGDAKQRRELNIKYISSAVLTDYTLTIKYTIGVEYKINLQTMASPIALMPTMADIMIAQEQGKLDVFLQTRNLLREQVEPDSNEKRKQTGKAVKVIQSNHICDIEDQQYIELMKSFLILPNNRNRNYNKDD